MAHVFTPFTRESRRPCVRIGKRAGRSRYAMQTDGEGLVWSTATAACLTVSFGLAQLL
jgi:hypothetical protein